jgi:predicted nucleic acid-binding protein
MPPMVVYDACVLHPAPLRDLLIRVARASLVRARWTDAILNECFRSIVRRRPELAGPLERTRALMTIAVPDSLITGYEALVDTLVLPDPDDRHVLAAAIHAGAKLIVTSNLVDFPPENLARYHLKATHPDAFIHALIDSAPDTVLAVVIRQAADLQNPPRTIHDVLDMLQAVGLGMSVARLRELIAG